MLQNFSKSAAKVVLSLLGVRWFELDPAYGLEPIKDSVSELHAPKKVKREKEKPGKILIFTGPNGQELYYPEKTCPYCDMIYLPGERPDTIFRRVPEPGKCRQCLKSRRFKLDIQTLLMLQAQLKDPGDLGLEVAFDK